jgi:hypothetical protein
MRCRKVRSFLPASYRNELPVKRKQSVEEHLQQCPDCRQVETAYRDLFEASRIMENHSVSEDFNARLLNRIARERFRETRTKAYFPKSIPIVTANRVAAVVATICFIMAFIYAGGINSLVGNDSGTLAVSPNSLDESYRTVQPETNRALAEHVTKDWAFRKQLARANRIKQLMYQLSNNTNYGTLTSAVSGRNRLSPYIPVVNAAPASVNPYSPPKTDSESSQIREANSDS